MEMTTAEKLQIIHKWCRLFRISSAQPIADAEIKWWGTIKWCGGSVRTSVCKTEDEVIDSSFDTLKSVVWEKIQNL